jgi:hypothetical protein
MKVREYFIGIRAGRREVTGPWHGDYFFTQAPRTFREDFTVSLTI